jgi:hypothetical protein
MRISVRLTTSTMLMMLTMHVAPLWELIGGVGMSVDGYLLFFILLRPSNSEHLNPCTVGGTVLE